MKITIDGRELEVKEGQTVLDVARQRHIDIPTLCYNEAVGAYGACRLCIVEVEKKGRKKLVTSCLYPVEEGIKVETKSEKVISNRKMIMQLLLARCPNNQAVKDMAKKVGVTSTPFKLEDKNCILCGLCTRACEQVVGASAISLVNRGVNREVAGPFYAEGATCIGCGSCAYVCPINAISIEDKGGVRTITYPSKEMDKAYFTLRKCKKCGAYWAPEKQIAFICKTTGQPSEMFDLCPDCRP
jgi:bidirectional [NiFe] hydrogenase diaphorase subunit